MIDPIESSFQTVTLNQLKVAVRRTLPREMVFVLSTTEADSFLQHETDRMVLELKARVLAQQLPPQTMQHLVRVETLDPRHATWWDHYKATYQQRWWMRWHTWTVRYVDTPVTVQRLITVTVRDHWTFPEASIVPPDQLGRPVMVAIWNAQDVPW